MKDFIFHGYQPNPHLSVVYNKLKKNCDQLKILKNKSVKRKKLFMQDLCKSINHFCKHVITQNKNKTIKV